MTRSHYVAKLTHLGNDENICPPHLDRIWVLDKIQIQILSPLPTSWPRADYLTSLNLGYAIYKMRTVRPTKKYARIKWKSRFESAWHKKVLKIQILTLLSSRCQYTLNQNAKNSYENSGTGAVLMKPKRFPINQIFGRVFVCVCVGGMLNEIKLQWADTPKMSLPTVNMLHYMTKGLCRSH